MRVRYSLLSALSGKIRVNEVRLDDMTVHVLRREDGTTNLPVFPSSSKDREDREHKSSPQDLRVADVRISGERALQIGLILGFVGTAMIVMVALDLAIANAATLRVVPAEAALATEACGPAGETSAFGRGRKGRT